MYKQIRLHISTRRKAEFLSFFEREPIMTKSNLTAWEPPASYNLNEDERTAAMQIRALYFDMDQDLVERFPDPISAENKDFEHKGRFVFFRSLYEASKSLEVKEEARNAWLQRLPKNKDIKNARNILLKEFTKLQRGLIDKHGEEKGKESCYRIIRAANPFQESCCGVDVNAPFSGSSGCPNRPLKETKLPPFGKDYK